MNTILKTIAPTLLVALFAFPAVAQTSPEWENSTERRAYLYATFCESNKSAYRKQACELLFTKILVDLGGRQFNRIASRKYIDKIHNIID